MLEIGKVLRMGFASFSAAFYPSPPVTDISLVAQRAQIQQVSNEIAALMQQGIRIEKELNSAPKKLPA